MFEEEKNMSTLSQKIMELLERYKALQVQNEELRQEVVKAKAMAEAKNVQIAKLEHDLINKDVNADDLLSKIEAVLGK
ncbi:MAG: ABC transporter [Epsilonproteobacteria bacterium]|nr:ABC transporter [Campylobacterota bacterium]